jgi:hypothetical protein
MSEVTLKGGPLDGRTVELQPGTWKIVQSALVHQDDGFIRWDEIVYSHDGVYLGQYPAR